MDKDKIYVFDDLLTIEETETIKQTMLGEEFPWYVGYDQFLTAGKDWNEHFSKFCDTITDYCLMSHVFITKKTINSGLYEHALPPIQKLCKHLNLGNLDLIRIKSNFYTKVDKPDDHHQTPHTDDPMDHWVMIYYANDSDGDTFIFNERLKPYQSYKDISKLTIKQRVPAKQGRMVMFHGSHIHAGSHPMKSDYRMVINYVFSQ